MSDYRKRAEMAERRARLGRSDTERRKFEEIARLWRRLAQDTPDDDDPSMPMIETAGRTGKPA